MVVASWQRWRGKWILTAPPAALLLSLEHQSKVDFRKRSLQSPRGSGRDRGRREERGGAGRGGGSTLGEPEQVIMETGKSYRHSVSCYSLHSNIKAHDRSIISDALLSNAPSVVTRGHPFIVEVL